VPSLDGVRGLTSLSIALTHVQLVSGWVPRHRFPLTMRWSWVVAIEFFFVLGGWVAMLPVAQRGAFEGLRSYGLRRVGRILPTYYLSLVVIVAIGAWIRPPFQDAWPHGFAAVLVHAGFLQEMVYPGRVGLGVNLVVWSMTIAALFYVTFPLVIRWYLRHPFLGLAAGIGVSVAWRVIFDGNDKAFQQYPLFVADFAVGMTAAWLYVRVWRRGGVSPRRALAVVGAGLPVFAVLLWLVGHGIVAEHQVPRHEHLVVAIAVPAVFALLISTVPFLPRWAQWPLDNRLARWIGDVSFGLFMFHFVTIYLMVKVLGIATDGSPKALLELLASVIPASFAIAWLATRYVEEPARAWMRARAARLEAPPDAYALPKIITTAGSAGSTLSLTSSPTTKGADG
jgi:peptidoglycan/LPS O-acetylase OafA/YrhL